ncbi:MAG: hypothetical protein FE78DRAFT_91107 [Acidomyces sp. 'richmondensis']|nr:MAG: hypothetical protein FE78DRAFT_91107 [Acidomyces sp. 'richmondensis']
MSLSPSANIVTSHVASHRRGASWQSSYELVPAIDVTRPASRGERITRPVSPPYTSTDEDMEGEEDPATPLRSQKCCPTCGSRQEKGSKQKLIARGIWSPTVFCLLAIVVVLLMLYYVRSKGNQYLATDFVPARAQIATQRVRFSGTASFDENGSAYRTSRPGEPQYVGTPTREIDDAWTALVGGRYFYLTEEEAREAWPDTYQEYYHDEFGYRTGLDVLHTLHCVNHLRKTLYVDYYPHYSMGKPFQKYHVDHCIDIIRQAVQCYGDLTPIPVRWFESAHRTFIDSDQIHTCRDFSKIRNWATERYNGSLAVHVREGLEAPE